MIVSLNIIGCVLQAAQKRREVIRLAEKMFMRVYEVAEALDISTPYAYKLIRKLNEELKKQGCIVIAGRLDRKYFCERFYGSHSKN